MHRYQYKFMQLDYFTFCKQRTKSLLSCWIYDTHFFLPRIVFNPFEVAWLSIGWLVINLISEELMEIK